MNNNKMNFENKKEQENPSSNSSIFQFLKGNKAKKIIDDEFLGQSKSNNVFRIVKYKYKIYDDLLYLLSHIPQQMNESSIDNDDANLLFDIRSAISYIKHAFNVSEDEQKLFSKIIRDNMSKMDLNEAKICRDEIHFISVKKDNIEKIEAHCALMQIVLIYELETSKVPPFHWSGNFSFLARNILNHHAESLSMSRNYISQVKWTAFIETHIYFPLRIKVFHELLDELICSSKGCFLSKKVKRPVSYAVNFITLGQTHALNKGVSIFDAMVLFHDHLNVKGYDCVKFFWDSTYKLFDTFLSYIQDAHSNLSNSTKCDVENLKEILELINRFEKVYLPIDIEERNFRECVKKSLSDGLMEHIMNNIDNKILSESKNKVKIIQELIKMIKFAQDHMTKFVDKFGRIFVSTFEFSLSEHLYNDCDIHFTLIMKPIILNISNSKEGNIENFDTKKQTVAVKLFDLYRELKNFADYGMEVYGHRDFKTKEYFSWFSNPVHEWHSDSVFGAKMRIEKSVKWDNLKPTPKTPRISSSAKDTTEVLVFVKNFWRNLQTLEKYKEQNLAKLIAADLGRFASIFFELFKRKIENTLEQGSIEIIEASSLISIAVENFNYVIEIIQELLDDLNKKQKVDVTYSTTFIVNTIKNMEDVIYQILSSTLKKFDSKINLYLHEDACVEVVNDENTADKSVKYIQGILATLTDKLPNREFAIANVILWDNVLSNILSMTESSKQKPNFFKRLTHIFKSITRTFYCLEKPPDDSETLEKIRRIEHFLQCFEYETSRLIHEYYMERYQVQQQIENVRINTYGTILLISYFKEKMLVIKVQNVCDFVPYDFEEKYERVVRISIVPQEHFPSCQDFKIDLHNKSDDHLEFKLSKEQRDMSNAIIHFTVERKVNIGKEESIVEAFLAFKDISKSPNNYATQRTYLVLTKLRCTKFTSLEAIRHKSHNGDKEAENFLSNLNVVVD